MRLCEVQTLLNARILTDDFDPDLELTGAFASDKLSHVLAFINEKSVLITALYNMQVIRTADLMGITCIIFIGREEPEDVLIEKANDLGLTVLLSPYSMYVTSGILYKAGLNG